MRSWFLSSLSPLLGFCASQALEALVTQVQMHLLRGDWAKQSELSQLLMKEAVWRCPGGGQEAGVKS